MSNMRILLLTVSFGVLIFLQGVSQNDLKYDFDETKYKFDTPDSLVTSFILSLKYSDKDSILRYDVSKEVYLYFIEQISIKRSDAQNIDEAISATEQKYSDGQNQFYTAVRNLKWHMKKDSIDINKIKVVDIVYNIED